MVSYAFTLASKSLRYLDDALVSYQMEHQDSDLWTNSSLTVIFLASSYTHSKPPSRHLVHMGLSLEQYDRRLRQRRQLMDC